MEIIALLIGLVLGLFMLLLGCGLVLAVAPFFKEVLLDDPDNPGKFALFTSPEPGRSSVIMRNGRVEHVVHGKSPGETSNASAEFAVTIPFGEKPADNRDDEGFGNKLSEKEQFKNPLFRAYDSYAFMFGLRFIGIPGIHEVYSYDLPRYRKTEEGGEVVYTAVTRGTKGFRSNHVRTKLTPWFYLLKGVDIEGIPFSVKGAAYIFFEQDRVTDALFEVESWSTLLYQALNSTVRGTLREHVSLDDAIGGISQDIWEEKSGNQMITESNLQEMILDSLLNFKLKSNGKTLREALGLVVERNDILDFAPEELSQGELEKLRAPALQRRLAQGRVLEGKAEAKYQEEVLAVLAKHPELAKANVSAEAFVKAAKAGTLDALAAGLLKKLTT